MHLKCPSLKKKKCLFFKKMTIVHLTKESISGFCRRSPGVKIKSLTLVALNNELLCLWRKGHFLEKL